MYVLREKSGLIILIWLILVIETAVAFPHVAWDLSGAEERIEQLRKGDISLLLQLPEGALVHEDVPFELKQLSHAFYFGGSLAADWKVPEQDWYPDFKRYFSALFNYATIDFYWAVHAKEPGVWNYLSSSREKLNWAKSEGMRLRGHPLMWHEVVPEWISSTERSVEALEKDILEHVQMLVREFPEIDEWDLHNETPGIRLQAPEMGVRRWVESVGGIGPATERLVQAVRDVRPEGRYLLNHFTDADPEYHEQIRYCLSNEVPFDAIGIQTHMHHLNDAIPEERLWNALHEYALYGQPIHLSEITILSCEMFPEWSAAQEWYDEVEAAKRANQPPLAKPSMPAWEAYQAALTRDFYTLAFSHPAVEAIVWWTITDVEPWRGMPAGLLDQEGEPKPVYHVLDELINDRWKTRQAGVLEVEGELCFRGFYGSYEVKVELDGVWYGAEFELSKQGSGMQTVCLERL